MSSKKTPKATQTETTETIETTETTERKAPRRVHVVPEPEVAERTVELDAPTSDDAEQEETAVEAVREDVADENAAGHTETKRKAARAGRLAASKKRRAFESAVKRLGAFDPEEPEMVGLAGVLSLLRTIQERLQAKKTDGRAAAARFEPGDEVKLRAKAVAKFDGIIAATDKLVATAVNPRFVTAVLASGEKVVLARQDVELAS